MKVKIVAHTPNPAETIARAAKICYATNLEDINKPLTDEQIKKYLSVLKKRGHLSPFEHASFTFLISDVTRTLLAQITRHRIASFSVRSQRYCDEEGFKYLTPQSIVEMGLESDYRALMTQINSFYKKAINNGVPRDDARLILPNATYTNFVFTMNVRELYHFFGLRLCSRALKEHQRLAKMCLDACKEVAPDLFDGIGAICQQEGFCREGTSSCGRFPTIEKIMNK